jgi:anti-sigma-K factor RskA
MSSDEFSTGDERDLMAAEHALGLLEGEEAARALTLVRDDPDFAARVERWRGRLAPLSDELEAVEPGPDLLARIERAIATTAPVGAANDNLLRRKLARWRFSAATMAAVAASLAVVLATRPVVIEPAPTAVPSEQVAPAPMVARLMAPSGPMLMMATYDPTSRRLVIAGGGDTVRSGRSHELWMIPAGGKPVSMGVMPAGKPMTAILTAEQAAAFHAGPTLAVSDEPVGGSPTGQPTGDVLASGALTQA